VNLTSVERNRLFSHMTRDLIIAKDRIRQTALPTRVFFYEFVKYLVNFEH